jgi:H2-forming N5,N10-methylenetetrahydromethanopterin dehydrogenase-like enzyme
VVPVGRTERQPVGLDVGPFGERLAVEVHAARPDVALDRPAEREREQPERVVVERAGLEVTEGVHRYSYPALTMRTPATV